MLSWRPPAADSGSRRNGLYLIASSIAAALICSTCTSLSTRSPSIPAEIVEWQEKPTVGVDRVFVVKIAYRDAGGALCKTSVEVDQGTLALMRRSSPCIIPFRGRYTVSACPSRAANEAP